jgi:MoaA/NifB/PqqE/SkfB family radical SAM enzyme
MSGADMKNTSASNSADHLEGAIIVLTEQCNSRCGMCDYWKSHPARSLAADVIEDFWQRRVTTQPDFITLSGGEPLLFPELFRLADFFKPRADHLVLSTNGLILADHYQDVAGRFDKVIISLDGASPETYHKVRGVDGWKAVTQAAAALRSYSSATKMIFKMTIQKENFRDLPDLMALARDLGADGVALAVPDLVSAAFIKPDADKNKAAARVLLSPGEAEEFAGLAHQVCRDYRDLINSGYLIEGNLDRFVSFFRDGYPGRIDRECFMARRRLIVNADGALRPCFFLPPLGRIEDPAEGEIFDSEPFQNFRRGFSSWMHPACSRCFQFLDWRFQ